MPRKKGSSEGSIYYNKQRDNWIVQKNELNYETGEYKRVTKSFKTKEEAEMYIQMIQYQKGNSIYIKNNGIPLNQLMRSMLQRKLDNGQIGERQFARVECTIKVIENSVLSKKKIEDITSEEIQGYFNTLKKYSNSYIKKISQQFNQAFKYAMDKGYIRSNPMIDVFKPKSYKEDKVVRALEVEEQQALTEYLINTKPKDFPFKNAFLMQLYMGLRIGEVLALRNSDVDLKHNLIKVDKTLTTDKNGKVIMGKGTKTYAGTRTLPIPEFLRPFVIEQMQIAKNNKNEQFFMTQNNNYADGRSANYHLRKIMKEQFGITDISTHSLRHSYGTRCVEAGMRAVALQRLMGHTDVSITLNTYTSVFNKYKEEELQKVNEYYLENEILKKETKSNGLMRT